MRKIEARVNSANFYFRNTFLCSLVLDNRSGPGNLEQQVGNFTVVQQPVVNLVSLVPIVNNNSHNKPPLKMFFYYTFCISREKRESM